MYIRPIEPAEITAINSQRKRQVYYFNDVPIAVAILVASTFYCYIQSKPILQFKNLNVVC